jgi:hypothetical protein
MDFCFLFEHATAGDQMDTNEPVTSGEAGEAMSMYGTQNLPPVSSSFEKLDASVPEWVLGFQQQFRAHTAIMAEQGSRLDRMESLLNENAALKKELAAANARIAQLEHANAKKRRLFLYLVHRHQRGERVHSFGC